MRGQGPQEHSSTPLGNYQQFRQNRGKQQPTMLPHAPCLSVRRMSHVTPSLDGLGTYFGSLIYWYNSLTAGNAHKKTNASLIMMIG
jgi:hypothetical protein